MVGHHTSLGTSEMDFRDLRNFSLAFLSILILMMISSCVSVKIPTGGSDKVRAAGVEFVAPANPFSPVATELADQQWTSSKTGNSISYFTECKVRNEPSLEVLEKEVLSAIDQAEVKREKLIYNDREALRIKALGRVDGVAVEIDSLIFKKNTCSYTLTFGGRKGSLKNEQSVFDSFLKDFKAP